MFGIKISSIALAAIFIPVCPSVSSSDSVDSFLPGQTDKSTWVSIEFQEKTLKHNPVALNTSIMVHGLLSGESSAAHEVHPKSLLRRSYLLQLGPRIFGWREALIPPTAPAMIPPTTSTAMAKTNIQYRRSHDLRCRAAAGSVDIGIVMCHLNVKPDSRS
ncbi:hypothetical protein LY76DRAFT_609774 [Colletotrichum caudatum]|nr:hypothetical protein LY76DRAFT_609774 [Colletotrichum caudatum]